MESNDSPEIPDRGETSDFPGLPSWGIKAEIMYVADIATYEGIVPYQTICKLIGEAPNRRLYSTMLVTQLSIYFKVILVENPDELADVPVFHDEKIYNVRNFRKKLVEVKAAEP